MRWVVRIFLAVLGIVVLAVGIGVVILSTTDFTAYRGEIASRIEAATGRKVTFGGKIETKVLTLSPRLVINDVSFANAKGGSHPHMVTARRAEVSVALLPLITGSIKVRKLALVGANILLETDRKGRPNWAFGKAEKQPDVKRKTNDDVPAIGFNNIAVRDTKFVYRDGKTGLISRVSIKALQLTTDSDDTPIKVTIDGAYNGTAVRLNGSIGSLNAIRAGAKDMPIQMRLAFGTTDAVLRLQANLKGRVPRVSGSIQGSTLDLGAFAGKAKDTSKSRKDGRLFSGEPLSLGGLHAANGDVSLAFDRIKSGDQQWKGVAARLILEQGRLHAKNLSIGLAGGQVKGDLVLDARTARPALRMALFGRNISLAQLTRAAAGQQFLETRLAVTAKLSGQGRSMQEIAGSLAGPLIVVGGPGPINSGTLSLLSSTLGGTLSSIFTKGGRLSLRCLVTRFDFRQGIGRSRVLTLDTTRLTAIGEGWINLRTESLNILFAPTTKGVSLASVAALVPVRVRGPIRGPSFLPDPSNAAKGAVKSILQTGKLGVGTVTNLLGIGEKKNLKKADPCVSARAQLSGRAPAKTAPKQGTSTSGQKKTVKPGNLLKKLNPFNR